MYNHVRGGWHAPRRLVRYSGAPADFSLGFGFAVVAVASPVTTPTVDAAALSLLCLSAIYTVARRRMGVIAS